MPPHSKHRSPRFCSSHFYRHACAPMVHAHTPSTGSRTCAQSRRPPLHPPQTSTWAQLRLGHCRDATLGATWTDRVLCPRTQHIHLQPLHRLQCTWGLPQVPARGISSLERKTLGTPLAHAESSYPFSERQLLGASPALSSSESPCESIDILSTNTGHSTLTNVYPTR